MSLALPSIPEAVSSVSFLSFLARNAVEGTLTGLHRSGLFGSSIEFAEHKAYSPGDDLKDVDWKVYGRTDKFYLKRFEDETNLRGYLVLDSSSSMDFGTAGHTKFQYAQVLTATLAYALVAQQDLVGLLRFGPGEPDFIPPRGRMPHFQYLTETLLATRPAGEKKLHEAFSFLMERIRRRGVVLVVSDFLAPIEAVNAMARVFRAGRHDVYWFQILDPAEIDFPYTEWTRFQGLEGERPIEVHAREAARSYRREIVAWTGSVRDAALANNILYRLVRTDEPIPRALASVLA